MFHFGDYMFSKSSDLESVLLLFKVLLLTEFRVDEIRDIALYSDLIKIIYIYG